MYSLSVIWRSVVGYEELYEVSSSGLVRGKEKEVSGNHKKPSRKIPARDKKQCLLVGYPAVTLFKDSKPKLIKVHRLVAEAFLENPDSLPCVNHIDNNKANNDVSNLEWCTHEHNTHHMLNQGRQNWAYGERSSSAKLTAEDVVLIKKLSKHMRQIDIAIMFGIRQQQVSRILTGKRWKHLNENKEVHPIYGT